MEAGSHEQLHDELHCDRRRLHSSWSMVCGIPAAYALSRMKFKGQTAFLGFVIVSQMFAPVVLLIGIYKVMMAFHLTNSIIGLIFINAAFNQAFAIWLLRGTFLSISLRWSRLPLLTAVTAYMPF